MSSLTLPSSRYSIFISSVRLSWNSSCKIATFPLWLFSLPYSILFPSIALATTWHMPVSHTKRVGQVGTLFSSLFHLKYPKQCLVNSMKATVLAAKRILLHLPNAVNSFFFSGILIKTIESLVDVYSFIFLMDAPWQIGSLIFIILGFLPSLAHPSYICQHEFKKYQCLLY